MRSLHFETRFEGVYTYFTSFGFFSEEENRQVLEKVGRALKPGGRFLFETVNRDWIIHKVEHQPRRWEEPEKGFFLLEDISFNAHTSRIHTKRIILDQGRQRSVEFDIKLYTHAELEDLLEEAGMRVIATYGNKDFSAYSVSSPRMAVVSRKE
jgi:SAM-dependent methyltransferase